MNYSSPPLLGLQSVAALQWEKVVCFVLFFFPIALFTFFLLFLSWFAEESRGNSIKHKFLRWLKTDQI